MPSSMDNTSRTSGNLGAHPALGYETRDANAAGVLGFLVFLFVVLALILVGSWLLFRYYSVAERQPAPASSFAGERQIPTEPELEINGRADFLKSATSQQQKLETYAWEDRQKGTVRVPIERAMDLLAKKGLPVVPLKPEEGSSAKVK
jgi:hypothetical protein